MTESRLNYEQMVSNALRGVVRDALSVVSEHGLDGAHSLYITFSTQHRDVNLPPYLKAQFPETMTIVLQHQFWGLEVEPDQFAVTLSFRKVHERLTVPFEAVTAFADPSVNFVLQFDALAGPAQLPAEEDIAGSGFGGALADPTRLQTPPRADDGDEGDGDETPRQGAEVVALDAFRKK